MKYITYITAGICVVILIFAWNRSPAERGCASVHSTAMGAMFEGPNGKNRLQWDSTCPSGVAWVAK